MRASVALVISCDGSQTQCLDHPVTQPKVPPAGLVRIADKLRALVYKLHQKLAPPQVTMLDMITNLMVVQAVHVAARLGIADELNDGPLAPDEIARRVDADPDATAR